MRSGDPTEAICWSGISNAPPLPAFKLNSSGDGRGAEPQLVQVAAVPNGWLAWALASIVRLPPSVDYLRMGGFGVSMFFGRGCCADPSSP